MDQQAIADNGPTDLQAPPGYVLTVKTGERILEAPSNVPASLTGCEVFIGRLPRFILEDVFMSIFEDIGPIYKMRLMMSLPGTNRGYAFIVYKDPKHADQAIRQLNYYRLGGVYSIRVLRSVNNCRLFVGNIPRQKTHAEIWNKLVQVVTGIVNVDMHPSHDNYHVNRGYVFVDFEDHRSALIARIRLRIRRSANLWRSGQRIYADWCDPIPHVDEAIMNQVSRLHIGNIRVTVTRHQLTTYIGEYVPLDSITRIDKRLDYAFINFDSRENAEFAYNRLQGVCFEGRALEVSWARPRWCSRLARMYARVENFCMSVPGRRRRFIESERIRLQAEHQGRQNHLTTYYKVVSNGLADCSHIFF